MEWARLLHGKVHGTRPLGRPIKELQLDNIRKSVLLKQVVK